MNKTGMQCMDLSGKYVPSIKLIDYIFVTGTIQYKTCSFFSLYDFRDETITYNWNLVMYKNEIPFFLKNNCLNFFYSVILRITFTFCLYVSNTSKCVKGRPAAFQHHACEFPSCFTIKTFKETYQNTFSYIKRIECWFKVERPFYLVIICHLYSFAQKHFQSGVEMLYKVSNYYTKFALFFFWLLMVHLWTNTVYFITVYDGF